MKKADTHTTSKREFVQKLTARTGIGKELAEKIFIRMLDLIVEEIKSGNKIEFRGTFILGSKVQQERVAQNPKTLEKVTIPERRVVYFKKGDRLKNLENMGNA